MSPRIAYWVSSFAADMEAVASEAALLSRAFPGSIRWGVSPHPGLRFSARAGFAFSPRWSPVFRVLAGALQWRYDVNHIFGGLGDWYHLRTVAKHPVVLTVAVSAGTVHEELLSKVDRFVIEWPGGDQELVALGIDADRIEVILPPVDLAAFAPRPRPPAPFTVLFASSPDRADWLEARGVHLVIEAARLRRRVRFILAWRPWGDALSRVRAMIRAAGVSNVDLRVGQIADMAGLYGQVHATLFCMTERSTCKPAPNSVVESLACGRPVLITPLVGFSDLVRDRGAGVVVAPEGEAVAEGLDTLESGWERYAKAARALAVKVFDARNFVSRYRSLYERLA